MMLVLQNGLNWSLQNETEILDRTFDIALKRFDKRLLPTLNLLLLTNVNLWTTSNSFHEFEIVLKYFF
jgi:hypothetical protein